METVEAAVSQLQTAQIETEIVRAESEAAIVAANTEAAIADANARQAEAESRPTERVEQCLNETNNRVAELVTAQERLSLQMTELTQGMTAVVDGLANLASLSNQSPAVVIVDPAESGNPAAEEDLPAVEVPVEPAAVEAPPAPPKRKRSLFL